MAEGFLKLKYVKHYLVDKRFKYKMKNDCFCDYYSCLTDGGENSQFLRLKQAYRFL